MSSLFTAVVGPTINHLPWWK